MPELDEASFIALRDSIRNVGLLVPIEYDENGDVLDGHHRLRALRELGREAQHSRVIRSGLGTDADKIAHALALNVHRRHLTKPQRMEAIGRLRDAGWSTRRIAEQTGVPKSTVARDVSSATNIANTPTRVIGTDGRTYAATRPRKPTTVYVHTAHEHQVAQDALLALDGETPTKAMHLRRLERMGREKASRQRREALRDEGRHTVGGDIRCSSIADLNVDDESVDLILTDPPYLRADFEQGGPWDILGRKAARWLAPGGLILAYCGHIHLARAIQLLSRYEDDGISYWWTYAITFPAGGTGRQVRTRAIAAAWRPVLAYRKEGGPTVPRFSGDPVVGGGKEKDSGHAWQQGLHEARVFIDRLTAPGPDALIVDPFVGSGTIAVAAALESRRFIAADIDPDYVALAQRRVSEAVAVTNQQ